MSNQFNVKSFARGIKLQTQHVWTPAKTMQTALQGTEIEAGFTAPFRMSWTFTPDSETFGLDPKAKNPDNSVKSPQQLPQVCFPMVFPPPQGEFDAVGKTYKAAPQLAEITLSFDQRANPYGISDQWQVYPPTVPERPVDPQAGLLTACDLSRYDTKLTLIEKVPTIFDTDGNSETYQEILSLSIPGVSLFGDAQLNPYVIEGLTTYLNPYAVYYWTMQVPGLASLNTDSAVQTSALTITGTPTGAFPDVYTSTLHLTGNTGLGDTYTITTTGGGPYIYSSYITDTSADIISGLLLLAANDSIWTFKVGSNPASLVATHKNPGTTTDTVSSSMSNGAIGTFTTVHTHTGTVGNTVGVFDGTTNYVYQILQSDTLEMCATGLAAVIQGQNGYTATATGNVVTVMNGPGVTFKFTDVSANFVSGHTFTFFTLTQALLAMPNLNLGCQFKYPLGPRDYSASNDPAVNPYVQNIPLKHKGQPQHGVMTLLAQPAGDTLITGDDVQQVVTDLEAPILNKLKAGYGNIPAQEGDTFPWEQLQNDTGYQVITVPMFPNWFDVRAGSVNPLNVGAYPTLQRPHGVGFPYCVGTPPYTKSCDQRIISVPTGFVVHHVIVCQNTFPYPDNRIFNQGTAWGTPFLGTTKVGVALYNGLRGDDQNFQQIAYIDYNNSNYQTYLIDQLKLDGQHTNYLMLNAPLVWHTSNNGDSSYGGNAVSTGKPFWMGAGNSTTQARTPTAVLPLNFGGGSFPPQTTLTTGGENLLIVRWSIEAAGGLGSLSDSTVLCGPAGHQVILIGKQSTVGADTSGIINSSNPSTGVW